MNQSAYIGGALIGGFALFLAAKGRLTTYANVLWGPDTASLLPFGAIPLLSVGAPPAKPSGGGGGGRAVPAAGSASSAAGAANENAAMGAANDAGFFADAMTALGDALPFLAAG